MPAIDEHREREPFDPDRIRGAVPLPVETEAVARTIVDAAMRVHSFLGPGLLESVYELCLAHELAKRGMFVERQVCIPNEHDGLRIESGLRIDLLVEKQVIVENKAVAQMTEVFRAQTLSYLKLSKLRLALLINFNVVHLKDGLRRVSL